MPAIVHVCNDGSARGAVSVRRWQALEYACSSYGLSAGAAIEGSQCTCMLFGVGSVPLRQALQYAGTSFGLAVCQRSPQQLRRYCWQSDVRLQQSCTWQAGVQQHSNHMAAPACYQRTALQGLEPSTPLLLLLLVLCGCTHHSDVPPPQSLATLQSSTKHKHRKVKHGRHGHKRSKGSSSDSSTVVHDGGSSNYGSGSPKDKDYAPKEEEYQGMDIPSEGEHQHRSGRRCNRCSWAWVLHAGCGIDA